MMRREERWVITYLDNSGIIKRCYPKSKDKLDEQLKIAGQKGIRILHHKKLYPFSTNKNQHNFMLVSNICSNKMHDMESGEIEWNNEEYERMEKLKEKADEFFGLPLPVAWLTWEELKEAKEIANAAIMHRQDTCIANGRLDLIAYC